MSDKIVIDASIALKWQFNDELETEQAVKLFLDYEDNKIEFVVPRLFYYEIANAIHIAVLRKRITEDDGKTIISDLLEIETKEMDSLGLVKNAYRNARRYNISVYDSVYFTIANDNGFLFFTGDKKLYNTFKGRKEIVRWIGDYAK